MTFFIHKRIGHLSYVLHSRLTFYALGRTISIISASYFQECVSKIMVVGKNRIFVLPDLLAVSSLIYHNVISPSINGRFTVLLRRY